MSDDGAFALVVIALLGNPFSPAYARARARDQARARDRGGARDPKARALDFCSLHVALHGPRRSAWALRERAIPDAARSASALELGRSRVAIERGALVIDIHERTAPFPGLVAGRVIVHPEGSAAPRVSLDGAGQHAWWPVAPVARVEVELHSPKVRFRGHGYHDANAGSAPIDETFTGWTWSRARLGDRVAVAYDVIERSGDEHERSMVFGARGTTALEHTWRAPLPSTVWRIERAAVADDGHAARVARTLTDSPFYARSLVRTRLLGREALAVHEVLSAERLREAWVRFLVGFRMTSRT